MAGEVGFWIGFVLGAIAAFATVACGAALGNSSRHMPPTWRREQWRDHEDR